MRSENRGLVFTPKYYGCTRLMCRMSIEMLPVAVVGPRGAQLMATPQSIDRLFVPPHAKKMLTEWDNVLK